MRSNTILFANPYLRCDECAGQVIARRIGVNLPCGHASGATSACPSWGPVDGCVCCPWQLDGRLTHPLPTPPAQVATF